MTLRNSQVKPERKAHKKSVTRGASRIELEDFLPYRLSILSQAVNQSLAKIYAKQFNISVYEWRVITALGNWAPLSASAVGERTRMDKVRVSRAVSRLMELGLVKRQQDKLDRRRFDLRLSAKGARVYQQALPLARDSEQQLLQAINAREQSALDKMISKLQRRADELSGG